MAENQELARYLQMDADDLLAEIAISADPEAALHSPDALLAKGRAVVAVLQARLKELVCPHVQTLVGPEVELAFANQPLFAGAGPSLAGVLDFYGLQLRDFD